MAIFVVGDRFYLRNQCSAGSFHFFGINTCIFHKIQTKNPFSKKEAILRLICSTIPMVSPKGGVFQKSERYYLILLLIYFKNMELAKRMNYNSKFP